MKLLNATNLPPKGKIWAIFFLSLLFFACGGKETSGTVSENITVTAEIPEDSDDLEIIWEITKKPDNSNLSNQDLETDESGLEMSFIADVPGDFNFKVSVYQYNDEISTESFAFSISPAEELAGGEEEEDEVIEEEDAVAELINKPDTVEPVKWYDEAELAADLTPPSSVDPTKLTKTPEAVVSMPSPPPEKPKPKAKPRAGTSIPYDKNRFTIQVASKKNLDDAKFIAAALIDAGYDAYIQKAVFTETNEIWYRIRLGSYAKRETAQAVAQTLSEFHKEKAWVDFVRYEY